MDRTRFSRRRRQMIRTVVAGVAAIGGVTGARAQSLDPELGADGIQVRAPNLRFIRGGELDRLRDGGAVTFVFRLSGLSRPGGGPLVTREARFTLSYDLWEERFAVARAAPEPAAISHLTEREAEQWCLDSLALPSANLGTGRFWLRLEYVVEDPGEDEGPSLFSLGGLIDAFSQLGSGERTTGDVISGPYTLSDLR